MAAQNLDAKAVIEPLWFRQYLKTSLEGVRDVHLQREREAIPVNQRHRSTDWFWFPHCANVGEIVSMSTSRHCNLLWHLRGILTVNMEE